MRWHTDTGYFSWAADAEANTGEILSAEFFDDIRDTVMTGGTRRVGRFKSSGSNVEVIMDNDDIFGSEFVEVNKLANGCTRGIHERFWFYEKYLVFSDCTLAYAR